MPRELAQLLVDEGVVDKDGAERALARQREAGGALDSALLELGLVDEGPLTALLARAADLPPAPLSAYEAVDARARRVFPSKVAERHGLAPFALDGRELSLVATHPLDLGLLDEISFMLSLHLTPHVGPEWRVRSLIQRLYGGTLPARLARLAEGAGGMSSPPGPVAPAAPPPVPSVEVADLRAPSGSAAPPTPHARPGPSRPSGFTGFSRAGDEPLEPLAAALAQAAEAFELDWEAEALAAPLPAAGRATLSEPPAAPVAAAAEPRPTVASPAHLATRGPDRQEDRSAPPRWAVAKARAVLAEATSRDQVVLAVLRYARDFFEYAALFAVTRDAVAGHDALGPEDGARDVVRTVALYVADPGIFRTTLDTLAPYLGPVARDAPGSAMVLDGLGRGSPRTTLVYPILLRGRPICILYADNGQAPVSARRLGDLLLFLSQAGAAFERIIRARKGEPAAAGPAPAAEAPPPVVHSPEVNDAAVGEPPAEAAWVPDVAPLTTPPDLEEAPGPLEPPAVGAPFAGEPPPPVEPSGEPPPLVESSAAVAPPPQMPPLVEVPAQAAPAAPEIAALATPEPAPPAPELPAEATPEPAPTAPEPPAAVTPAPPPAAAEPPAPPPPSWAEPERPEEGAALPEPTRLPPEPAPQPAGPSVVASPALPPPLPSLDLADVEEAFFSSAPGSLPPEVLATPARTAPRIEPALPPSGEVSVSLELTMDRPLPPGPVAAPPPAPSLPPGGEVSVSLELTADRPLSPGPAAPPAPPPAPAPVPPPGPPPEVAEAYPELPHLTAPGQSPLAPPPPPASLEVTAEHGLRPAQLAVLQDPAALVGAYLVCPRGSDERTHLLSQLVERAAEVAPILCEQLPGPFDVAPELLAATAAPDQGPVLAAVAALGPAALKPLLAMLADPAPERRRAAVALLGQLGDGASFLPLAERCFDQAPAVAEAARIALSLHRRDPAMKPVPEKLRRALLSGLADKAAGAARAIAALRDAESIPLLIQALEGSDAATAAAAAEALAAITLQRHGTKARDWLLWWKQNRGRSRADWLFGALTAGDRELRLLAANELREAAASPVAYSADLPAAELQAAAQAWQRWFTKGGHRP